MKVMLHYEDNENTEYHKTLKITLPKSWKTGPVQNLVDQFAESYNPKFDNNQLDPKDCHASIRKPLAGNSDNKTKLLALASDSVVIDEIEDRADVYICHGKAETKQEQLQKLKDEQAKQQEQLANTVSCTRFGCNKRFPKGGPYPSSCRYHKSPPVFHETAKYWACCPNKKAYDWDDFQSIPGCCTADCCTDNKENQGDKLFLGGTDLREQMADSGPKLKSIDDFNKTMASGGAEAAPVLERLQRVLEELGIERELYNQVVDGMKQEILSAASTTENGGEANDAEVLQMISKQLGDKLKATFKGIAAEQLRIK